MGCQFVTALLYIVVAAGAFAQNVCTAPAVQPMSEVQPDVMQAPAEQMLVGGLQSVSLVHATVHAPDTHLPCGFPSACTQSGSVVQVSALQRWVPAVSHALPAAQSRSLAHVK